MTVRTTDWVLAVDDDPWALEITSVMLRQHDIPIHTTQTVEAALDAVRRLGPPAVLLLDAIMPGEDGFEVCRRLRVEPALRHTRIVFVTGLDDEASRLAALEAGADDLISKPFSEAILVARVRSLIELARLRDRDHAHLEYETVLDCIGEGVITVADDGRILTANEAARRLLGLPHGVTEPVDLLDHIERHWTVERGILARQSTARLVSTRSSVEAIAALNWTSREMPESADTHAAWTVVVRDVTDIWEGDRALSRLLRTLGHKLRIPLTGVATSLDLLDEDETLEGDARMLLSIARDSAHRLDDTLLRILEFLDVLSARAPRRSEVLDPAELRQQLELDPDVDLAVDLSHAVQIDLGVVRRGVAELVANARRAGAGSITLSVAGNPDDSVTFAALDDGRGVPHGIAARIFEPFYQVDRTGEGPGAGLGLSILAADVEAAGGRVGAQAPAEGPSQVWFSLPASPAAVRSIQGATT